MPMIEGVGDEVTIVAALTTVVFAAISTYLYRNLRLRDTLNLNVLQFWHQYTIAAQSRTTSSPNITNLNQTATEEAVPEPDSSTTDESSRTQSEVTTISESEVSSSSSTDVATEVTTETVSEESQSETLVESSPNTRSNESDSASVTPTAEDSTADAERSETTNLSNGNADSVPSDEIQVRLKYLNDTEKLVKTRLTETIGAFKRAHFESDLNENKVVRLIFNGQLLRDNMTLQSYRIENRTVLHVHVSQAQPQPNYATTGIQSDLDISSYMWPLFSIILALCWIMYIRYPEFFSVTSIILLVAFSASFFVVYVHSQVQYP